MSILFDKLYNEDTKFYLQVAGLLLVENPTLFSHLMSTLKSFADSSEQVEREGIKKGFSVLYFKLCLEWHIGLNLFCNEDIFCM